MPWDAGRPGPLATRASKARWLALASGLGADLARGGCVTLDDSPFSYRAATARRVESSRHE